MRRREPWRYGMLSAALMLAGVMAHACAEEEATYRDLARRYFATGDGKAISKFVGLTEEVKHVVALDYTVLIRKDGREEAVDPKAYQFALGDSIRIKIQPASDNYIYIFHQGASGERTCLLPVDKETPPLLKAGASFILPFDGYFEFVTPPGEEQIVVVATERPIAELAVLADVVFKKPGDVLTPQEQAIKDSLKATVQKTLTSIRNRHNETMTLRGLSEQERSRAIRRKSGGKPIPPRWPSRSRPTATHKERLPWWSAPTRRPTCTSQFPWFRSRNRGEAQPAPNRKTSPADMAGLCNRCRVER
jgi:hypothetical protein